MAAQPKPPPHRDVLEILLDKIAVMREELLAIERALERMQLDAAELTQRQQSGATSAASASESRVEPRPIRGQR